MPGMMDTILNLGLNDDTVAALATRSGNPRFAWDCYRRFVAMYGEVVMGVVAPSEHEELAFDRILEDVKRTHRARLDQDLTEAALREAVALFKAEILRATGTAFPDDVRTQLWGAIGAVFASWNNPRADYYRKLNGISATIGTAVNVQAMVFGNLGEDCATGVAFTRNPSTGADELYGEFLTNAQGEDVVAGVRTPEPIGELARKLPAAHAELVRLAKVLEDHFRPAGSRVHDPARPAVHAADPQRQTDRAGDGQGRGRHGRRGQADAARGRAADRSREARRGAASDDRSEGAPARDRQGLAGVARRRDRQDRVHRDRRRRVGAAR
jgi:hypothetical protein